MTAPLSEADGLQNYLVRGRNARGSKCVEVIRAASAQGAIDRAAADGWTEIVLETDELMRSVPGGGGVDVPTLSPRAKLALTRPPAIWHRLYLLQTSPGLLIAFVCISLVVVVAMRVARGGSPTWADVLIATPALIPVALVVMTFGGAAERFRKIQIAYNRADFPRVLELVEQEERSKNPGGAALSATIVAEWRGKALARLGRLEEGLTAADVLRQRKDINPSACLHVRAMVYAAARDREGTLRCYRELTEADPSNPLGWLGMVDVLALYLVQPKEARWCLEAAKELPLGTALRKGVGYCEGMVLLAEGKYFDARREFEAYLPELLRERGRTPLSEGLEAVLRAQLAIACARLGDVAGAREQMERAGPFMALHKMHELRARCEKEVGVGAG